MTDKTIPFSRLSLSAVPSFRDDVLEILTSKDAAVQAARDLKTLGVPGKEDPQYPELVRLRREVKSIWDNLGKAEDRLRAYIASKGIRDRLQIYVISEMRGLPDRSRCLTYPEVKLERNVLRAAWRILADGSTEFRAAEQVWFESPEGKRHDKERLKIRDKWRLKSGHWASAKIRAAKRNREAARYELVKEAKNAARRAKYATRRANRAMYVDMLDEDQLKEAM